MSSFRVYQPARLALRVLPNPRSFPTSPRTLSIAPQLRASNRPIYSPSLVVRSRPFASFPHLRNDWPPRQRSTRENLPHYDPNDPHWHLANAKPLVSEGALGRAARSPSTYTVIALSFVAALIFYFSNLEKVPVSGRQRFNVYSAESMEKLADQQVKRIVWDIERQGGRFLSDWDPRTRMVKRVMARLIPVSGMQDSNWEIRVIDDDSTANAFVLPGGKVFVYSGIIPIARNEDGLAAVLGHEIAHNLADHMAERASGQIGINILLGSMVLLLAFGGGAIFGTQIFGGWLLDFLFGLPMGRRQESEADYIGLMLMSEACYDPRGALEFWKRMERQSRVEPPEMLSTHPSNHNRVEKIQEWMPKALEKMQMSDCKGTAKFAELFKQAMQRGVVIE